MGDDFINLEAFVVGIDEVIFVAEEDLSLDAPVIVDEVGIEKVDAPPFALWWETAEEEHFSVLGQEGDEGVIFHLIRAASDVGFVQIGHD